MNRITANEVAVGTTMPHAALELCRQRLKRAHVERAAVLAEVLDPGALAATKARLRAEPLGALRRAIEVDDSEPRALIA